ncbi:MAG: amino acid adenylation domain-containing protein, partial [Acidobacteriaceae bacterium]|nr:amino acid adenylation domain-containing protein [Acidobacteriaceae bacterium]
MPVWPPGSILPLIPPNVAELFTIRYRRSLQAESERLILYSQYPALQVPEYYGPSGSQTAPQQVSLIVELAEAVQARVKQSDGVNFLLAAFAVFWQRKGTASPYRLDAYFPLEEELAGLFSSNTPVFINVNRDASIGDACDIAYQALCRAQRQGPLLLDTFFRYPDHSAHAPAEISVSVGLNLTGFVENTSALQLSASPDGRIVQLSYASDRITPESAERIALQFSRFALTALENPSTPLRAVPLLDQEEQDCVLYRWNDTVVFYPLHLSIVDLFVENTKKSPQSIAVVYEGTILTYEELNRRSAQLAAHLSANGVGCGTLVGVFLDRSAELVVALLGILKAGGTYIPLDPSYPDVRLEQILEDTGARFLITESALNSRLVHRPHFVFCQDTDRSKLTGEPSDFLFSHPRCQPESPAYLIYTSGSTGKPKGVPIPHRGLTNLMFAYAKRIGFGSSDCLVAISSIGFDWSIADLFLPLAHGARLEILSSDVIRDGQQLAERIEKGTATVIQGTPGAWRLMLAGGWTAKRPITLASGGEAMSVELAMQIQQRVNRLFNVYGPTETTVVSCGEEITGDGPIHLGRPLDNYRQYVLDNDLNPVGIGEVGEICIAGPGVSPGYHGLPDLNAEKFCLDPFRSDTGEMLYRSGDLGRFLPNGRIQFVSRKDQQIKLRGFRIEPAEIESRLLGDPEIRDCVVVLREEMPGQPRLVGFVVIADAAMATFSAEKHLDRLRQNLPSYMVPSSLICLSKLPVTVNKKIDRRRLSTAPLDEITEAKDTTGPEQEQLRNRDEFQQKLIVIVAGILGVAPEQVRSDSHFAELGLDSIQLTRLAWRIKTELGIRIEVTALYKFPTPRQLSSYLVPEQTSEQKLDLPHNLISELTAEPIPEVTASNDAIAIVGMAVRVSGASDLHQFWRIVTGSETQIQRASEYRRFPKAWYGSFLEDIDCFDAAFFGISPHIAALLDPQQRILLETCWHAFEDAGEQPAALSGSAVGVFVALPAPEYQAILDQAGVAREGFGFNALTGSVAANRVSWTFNLTGPSEVIDTGCSSSLIAIHRAVKALQDGECHMAVVAGVNLLLSPDRFDSLETNGILSENGIPSPFGASGNGLVRGEGVGVIVLKPGTKAESDGNRIHAFIKGTAVAHSGRTTSLAGPNPAAQAATIRSALKMAGVEAKSVTYVEAQGSGVPIGDHYEWSAFRDTFTDPGITPRQISTCKPHIGHLECAAGIVSTIKAVLAFHYGVIPGVLNSEQLHADLEQDVSRFLLARKNVEWSALPGEKRRAGVHGFGYGGTIAHVVLEEPPAIKQSLPAQKREIVLLSARSSEGLRNVVSRLATFLRNAPATPLTDLAHTLRVGRDSLPHRLAFVVDSAEQLCKELERYLLTNTAPYAGVVSNGSNAATTFFEDPEAAALLESWILRRRWEQLARLWVQGATIPWHRTPQDSARRIALPLYPFCKERYWITHSQPCTPPNDTLREQVLKLLPLGSALEENSNLFSLGIDSLGALRLLRQVAPDSSHRLQLNDLLADPTLKGLRRLVSGQSSTTTEFPLSAIQRFFWEVEQLQPETAAWHSPFAFRLDPRINRSRLRDALEALIKQYSILRSR